MEIRLMENCLAQEEFEAINKCLKAGRYTQGEKVQEFEEQFAKWNGSKYAVMVNSGSSANLLSVFILKEKFKLADGSEILVPAVTWPTTVYPIIQNNLVPVFCDVDDSYNISIDSIERMTTEKTKAIFLVHLLGQPANMKEIINFCNKRNIILLEDCCESLGAVYNNAKVGNFGVMSTFSFYFTHHITTIEGGMIVTQNSEIHDLLKSARSHGWIRNSQRIKKYTSKYPSTDFVFDMLGYNLRSTEINAAIGLVQLKKVDSFIKIRKENHILFNSLCTKAKPQKVNFNETSSFSFGIILNYIEERMRLLKELPKKGVECRPIIAGNLLQQPVFKEKLIGKFRSDNCKMSDEINDRGLYLPNNQFIDQHKIEYMVNCINSILR